MVSDSSASSTWPNCTRRMTWLGSMSMAKATGQPAEHAPH